VPIDIPQDGEVLRRVELCALDQTLVTALDWRAVLEKEGFAVQVAEGGWEGRGPLALRFRTNGAVGDVFGTADARGCRAYIVRLQRARGDRPWQWSSSFGDVPYLQNSFHRCIRFFAEDARFPFAENEYSWGCGDQ
jgi:hypothetical protein